MGGGGETKKTLEQVEQELMKTLYINANKLVATPTAVPDTITFENLSNLVTAVANQKFQSKYNYDYAGQATKTKPPPADGALPSATEGICSFHDINDDGIENFVDNRILSGLELGFVRAATRADLVSLGKKLFKQPSDNSWVVQDFTKDYENQNSTDDQYSRRSNSIFVYTNASLIVDGQEAKYVILSFIGVYFNIPSPTKIARDNLLNVILKKAKSLKPIGQDSSGTETQRLQVLLEPYLQSKFKEQNKYDFNANQTRPLDMVPGSENWVRGAPVFCCPQSNKVEDVVNYVNVNVLGAMKLPKYLKDENGPAYKDLLRHFETLLGQRTDNSWFVLPFDKTYDSPDAGENSTRTSAIMVWSNSSLTQANTTCKQLYLFYMGVYYQIESPQFIARKKLLTNLVSLAKQLSPNLPNPVSQTSPQLALKTILDEYAKRQFLERIGYEYDEKNCKPDDLATGKKAIGMSTMMYFPVNPVSVEAVATKLTDSIIGQVILPGWLETPLQRNLGSRVKSITDEAKLDSWNSDPYQRQFSSPRSGILPWNARAIVTYANGQMVEDGVTVTASMVHYLGIFYPTSDDNSLNFRMAVQPQVEEYDDCSVKTL